MADYESMTRDELIASLKRCEAELNKCQQLTRPNGLECEYGRLQTGRELFFERSPQPMFIHDRETMRFLHVNNAALSPTDARSLRAVKVT